jgi:hypothetical protein
MPKTPTFAPRNSGRKGWEVSIPGSMTQSGKQVRKFFATEKLAAQFSAELRRKYHAGQRGGIISYELAVMAESAANLLDPHGATIMDAARDFVARKEREAAQSPETFYERYMAAMLDGEMRWSDRYRLDMDRLPRWVGERIMGMRLADLTPEIIAEELKVCGAISQSTIQARARYVSAIQNYAPRHRKKSEIAIMTPRQCGQMLRAAESPAERRAVALLLWAGIRPSAEDGEITRLDWHAVGESEIYVGRSVSKTKTDRHIPITPRLHRLLRGHPKRGAVVPPNWRRVYARLRGAVEGIAGQQDVTRHTFASYYLAAYGDHAAKQAMGHTEGRTLFRHYRKAVTEADGKRFFR